ncbi:MAG: hypothetical protein JST00_38700 [Deltaproteobacteria bacterium]|nr:hypothetical protein [Deltaproteobacteria bacterium]
MEPLFSPVRMALVLGLVACAACTTGNAPPPSLTHGDVPVTCPLGVRDTTVTVVDVPNGVVLTFQAPPERLGELRERAVDAAGYHGPGERVGKGHDGVHGNGGDHGLQISQLPPLRALAENVEGGARITLVPTVAEDLEKLRTKVRARAAAMNASTCK